MLKLAFYKYWHIDAIAGQFYVFCFPTVHLKRLSIRIGLTAVTGKFFCTNNARILQPINHKQQFIVVDNAKLAYRCTDISSGYLKQYTNTHLLLIFHFDKNQNNRIKNIARRPLVVSKVRRQKQRSWKNKQSDHWSVNGQPPLMTRIKGQC